MAGFSTAASPIAPSIHLKHTVPCCHHSGCRLDVLTQKRICIVLILNWRFICMYSSPNKVKCDSGVAYYTLTMLCGESFTSFRFCNLNVVQETRFSFLLKTFFIHVLKTHLLALHDNPPRPTSLPFTPHPTPKHFDCTVTPSVEPTSFENMTRTIVGSS